MALAGAPPTPESQYITLMSSASKTSFPANIASRFTTRFDPPLELRGGEFNVGLMDIFHPTKWTNITSDKYYMNFDKKEKVPRNYNPVHYVHTADLPQHDEAWSWWGSSTSESRHREREELEEKQERDRRRWRERYEQEKKKEEEERKRAEIDKQTEVARGKEGDEEIDKEKEEERERQIERQREVQRMRQIEEEKRAAIEKQRQADIVRRREEEKARQLRHQREVERRRREEEEERRRREEEEERRRREEEEDKEETEEEEEEVEEEERRKRRQLEEDVSPPHPSPPPELDNRRWMTVAHQKLRVPSTYYPSIDAVLQSINNNIKEDFKDKRDDENVLSMDPSKDKVRLRLKVGVHIRFSRKLAELLGFKQLHHRGGCNKLADNPPHLKKHLGSLHVYMNAMMDRVVGDTMAPLIAMVPHVDIFPAGLKIAHHTFLRPNYFPIKQKFIDTVTCNIRDDNGDIIPFIDGDTTLTLHIVRASP